MSTVIKSLYRPAPRLLALLLALCIGPPAWGEDVAVAVAANFRPPMQELAAAFEAASGHRLVISYGSTGKHYAQIHHGAPFAAF